MAGNLQETLTVYLSRAPVFTPNFGGVRVAHICFLFLCVCVFIYALCLLCPMLPVPLDCLFLIAPSVFSNLDLHQNGYFH
jgi:hypothetical protein